MQSISTGARPVMSIAWQPLRFFGRYLGRFGVAGSLLLPYAMSKGLALERLGWIGLASIVVGCGAPMVLLVNAGLLFAPAAHAGALFPGVMPLMVAILAAAILREAFTGAKKLGFALILPG